MAADDIVTRLRDRVAAKPEFVPEGSVGHLIYEAADEIERLRKAIVDYVMTISDCYATPATDSDALELLKQAARGE